MNHKSTTLAVAAIIAAAAMTGVAFAIPQQVMAGGHGHGHGHNNHKSNGISVNQQVNQENQCPPPMTGDGGSSGSPPPMNNGGSNDPNSQGGSGGDSGSNPGTVCLNIGANSANIHR